MPGMGKPESGLLPSFPFVPVVQDKARSTAFHGGYDITPRRSRAPWHALAVATVRARPILILKFLGKGDIVGHIERMV